MGTIAIIGGGTGGASVARSIRRRLSSNHRIILIEQRAELYNQPVYPLVATGKRQKKNLARKIERLNGKGIEVLIDRAEQIDCRERSIRTGSQRIDYDLAIIAAGAERDQSFPPGMREAGLDAHSLEGAENIFSKLEELREGNIAILVASTRIKCPGSPYEYTFLIEDWLARRGRAKDINITIYTPEPSPLLQFGHRTSDAVSELLLKKNIYAHSNSRFVKVKTDPSQIELEQGAYPFDLLIYFPGAAPPPLIRESGLPNREGWLEVNRYLQATGQERVLGLGDATEIYTPSGETLPKMGAIAHLQSFAAAGNALKIMAGKKPDRTFSGMSG